MTDASTYSALNQLMIDLGRSLLQYVGECWPWTDPHTVEEQEKINKLVALQRQQVSAIGELLEEADWNIDNGTYPTEYTDLHYVALSYLLDQLIQNEQALIEEAKRTLPACAGRPEARKLVEQAQKAQESIVAELRALSGKAERSTKFA